MCVCVCVCVCKSVYIFHSNIIVVTSGKTKGGNRENNNNNLEHMYTFFYYPQSHTIVATGGHSFKKTLCKRMHSIMEAAPKIIDVYECIIKPSIYSSKLRKKISLWLHRFKVSNSPDLMTSRSQFEQLSL